MKDSVNQGDNFFENNRVFEIRNFLKLDQIGFGNALKMRQSAISNIEKNKTKLTRKTKSEICNVFFVDPLFFEKGNDAKMFLEGKENNAWEVAENFRKQKTSSLSTDSSAFQKSDPNDIQAIVIEKLSNELELKNELLKSRDELIVILKEQLAASNSNYENLWKEISELRKLLRRDVVEKLKDIDDNISSGESDNPNDINPVKNSG